MNWLKALVGCKDVELATELEETQKQLTLMALDFEKYREEHGINPFEEYYNNKYPKNDITYKRIESDGTYQVDLRHFINGTDPLLPAIDKSSDDEVALEALLWVMRNIKYTSDKTEWKTDEYWAYHYQTLKHKKGDCEDGAILLHNILLKNGVPYWKLRLTAGYVIDASGKKIGHAYLTYFCEETSKWVVLDWCFYPNSEPMDKRKDYKEEERYREVWFSWNQRYCFTQGLNTAARRLLQ